MQPDLREQDLIDLGIKKVPNTGGGQHHVVFFNHGGGGCLLHDQPVGFHPELIALGCAQAGIRFGSLHDRLGMGVTKPGYVNRAVGMGVKILTPEERVHKVGGRGVIG